MSDEATTTTKAEVVLEIVPFEDRSYVHGVTFDGAHVWFARNDELVCFDPATRSVVKRLDVPRGSAGTAFDGTHLYQVAGDEIVVLEPATGRIVRRFPTPPGGMASGMAWADGYLFVGQFREARIQKVDAKTGEVVKSLTSDRFVTGVSCVDGAVWHGASGDGRPAELRRLAGDGSVEETHEVPVSQISGVETSGDGAFWCGGEQGTLRLVRPRRRRAS